MIVYLYDFNGLPLGEYKCQLDKLESKLQEKEVYLIPANSTETPPPEAQEGEIVRFVHGQWTIEKAPELTLEQVKEQKITQSKTDLQTYLAEHPLQWTDGKYYTITAEKQQQLTSKLLSATFAKQTGAEYDLKWNDTEQVCEPWTLENLTALAFAIDARVTALVTYQQEKERLIRDAQTLKNLESIVVNYDEVV